MEEFVQELLVTKQKRWEEEKGVVDKITDRLGLKIDEGIKDTVIALRLLGVHTTSSHEGKMDRYPIPYIDLSSIEAEKLVNQRKNIIDSLKSPEEKEIEKQIDGLWGKLDTVPEGSPEAIQIREEIKKLESRYNDFDFPENEELFSLNEKINSEGLEVGARMRKLLDEFYKNRTTSNEARLEIEYINSGEVRLQSCGWKIQEGETNEEVRVERLRQFQEEMQSFTEFLKRIYFGT